MLTYHSIPLSNPVSPGACVHVPCPISHGWPFADGRQSYHIFPERAKFSAFIFIRPPVSADFSAGLHPRPACLSPRCRPFRTAFRPSLRSFFHIAPLHPLRRRSVSIKTAQRHSLNTASSYRKHRSVIWGAQKPGKKGRKMRQ